jgi:pyruvate/2-oxoglutarate/acetoin dehydrogenase E1 component
MAPHCVEAVTRLRAEEGLFVDLAVLSQLSPLPLSHIHDVVESARPRVFVYVEEASVRHGWSAEMLAEVQACTASPAPVSHVRVGALHTPIPSSRDLEREVLPQVDDIMAAVIECF